MRTPATRLGSRQPAHQNLRIFRYTCRYSYQIAVKSGMRIGIDYTPAINQGEGIGRYARAVVNALAEADSENSYVLLHARSRKEADQSPLAGHPNFVYASLPLSERAMTVLWHRLGLPLPVEFFTGPVDLFHAPDFVLPPIRTAASILTVHDLSFLLYPEYTDKNLVAYLEKVVPESVHRADLVLADSQNTKNDMVCLIDADPGKIEVVYLGVEERFRRVQDDEELAQVKGRYGLSSPFVLTVGTVQPRKNLARLMAAFKQVVSAMNIPYELLVVGRKGWLAEPIYSEVEELGLGGRVRFLGSVHEADLPALYNLASLFVFPSLYEGFGLPPLEAMACGTPVVASNASSLPEVVGGAALMVDPKDTDALSAAMISALTQPELRRQLTEKGLTRAKTFQWRHTAERLLELYKRVAG